MLCVEAPDYQQHASLNVRVGKDEGVGLMSGARPLHSDCLAFHLLCKYLGFKGHSVVDAVFELDFYRLRWA